MRRSKTVYISRTPDGNYTTVDQDELREIFNETCSVVSVFILRLGDSGCLAK
jgi:hypothetical protein